MAATVVVALDDDIGLIPTICPNRHSPNGIRCRILSAPMITRLQIQNFKSIAKADLEFGRVNLFIGANGAGKSNLLEAIGLYAACLGRGIDASTLSAKGVRLSAPRIFKSSFRNRRTPKLIRLQGDVGRATYQVSLQTAADDSQLEFHSESLAESNHRVFVRHGSAGNIMRHNSDPALATPIVATEAHRGVWDANGSLADVSSPTRQELHAVGSYVIYTPQTAVMRGLLPENRVAIPLGLTGGRLPKALRELLLQRSQGDKKKRITIDEILQIIWKPGWAKIVTIGPPDLRVIPDVLSAKSEVIYIVDKYMQQTCNKVSLYDASEGTLFLLFVAIILAHSASPPVFALDNVDGTLNPAMVRTLVAHIIAMTGREATKDEPETRTRQVFLTSHNPPTLDALDLFESDQRVFVVHRSSEGHTVFRRIEPPENTTKADWIATSGGRSLSRLWLDGWIADALGK